MECMVHGCSQEATDKVKVYAARCDDIPEGHGDKNMTAEVCPHHKALYDQQGYLGGLVIPDDPTTYLAQNKPHRDRI